MKTKLAVSMMCADWMNMGRDIKLMEEHGLDLLHCDIMDGHFVPNMMMPPALINAMGENTDIPLDIHIMCEQPEQYISMLDLRPQDYVSVHYESTYHPLRAIGMVKEKGAKAALAINPGTPIECVREFLPDLSMVLIMTVNPGFAGQKMVPQSLDKIRRMREMLDEFGYSDILIQVDGNCSYENAPKMRDAGADIVVVGTSSVFHPVLGVEKGLAKLREALGE